MKSCLRICLALLLATGWMVGAEPPAGASKVRASLDREYGRLWELYKHLHAHPELSGHEEKTSSRLAEELRQAGYEVTTGVGGHGIVGVLRNGSGRTVLVRADMDALPIVEQTGLEYASKVRTKDDDGQEVGVMHACGHDVHMTALAGTARVLAQVKAQWQGTLVLIGQPAEERLGGARRMLKDGLFTRFPRPDFCLALHVTPEAPPGTVCYTEGYALANVDMADIIVRGVGGHGAMPHHAKDPVVLASQIVLGLQTIVSREVTPGEAAVVTVGAIHGGTKHNIIPDEVHLQLTLRSYTDEVRQQTIEGIKRIARGQALAAGIPEERLPEVRVGTDFTPAVYNEPRLTLRLAGAWRSWLGAEQVVRRKPSMAGEDFSEYGRTAEKIPSCIFWIGAKPEGTPAVSLHSPLFAPAPEATIKTGVTAMTAAVLELMGQK
jgi:amidohydrolase